MTAQPTTETKQAASEAAQARHKAEQQAVLAKHLHPPKVETFKGIRL